MTTRTVKTEYKNSPFSFKISPINDERRIILNVLETIKARRVFTLPNLTQFDKNTSIKEIVGYARYFVREMERTWDISRGK